MLKIFDCCVMDYVFKSLIPCSSYWSSEISTLYLVSHGSAVRALWATLDLVLSTTTHPASLPLTEQLGSSRVVVSTQTNSSLVNDSCRRTLVLLRFFFFFYLFRPIPSELNGTELNQNRSRARKWVRFENVCPKSGLYAPIQFGVPKPPFSTTSQLNGNFNGLYLRNETCYT